MPQSLQQASAAPYQDLESLFATHRSRLFMAAFKILEDPHDAEDAVQEAAVSSFQNLHQLSDPADLAPWVISITRSSGR